MLYIANIDRMNNFTFGSMYNKIKEGAKKGSMKGGLRVERTAKQIVNVDTGRLKGSITTVQGDEGESILTKTGTNIEYAEAQEFGNQKFPGKPYMGPGFYENQDKVKKDIQQGVNQAMRGL